MLGMWAAMVAPLPNVVAQREFLVQVHFQEDLVHSPSLILAVHTMYLRRFRIDLYLFFYSARKSQPAVTSPELIERARRAVLAPLAAAEELKKLAYRLI